VVHPDERTPTPARRHTTATYHLPYAILSCDSRSAYHHALPHHTTTLLRTFTTNDYTTTVVGTARRFSFLPATPALSSGLLYVTDLHSPLRRFLPVFGTAAHCPGLARVPPTSTPGTCTPGAVVHALFAPVLYVAPDSNFGSLPVPQRARYRLRILISVPHWLDCMLPPPGFSAPALDTRHCSWTCTARLPAGGPPRCHAGHTGGRPRNYLAHTDFSSVCEHST